MVSPNINAGLQVSDRCPLKKLVPQVGDIQQGTYSCSNTNRTDVTCYLKVYCFQCVLHFMVGSTEGADGVSRDIIEVLLTSGLMKE